MPSNKFNNITLIGDDISINQLQVNMQKMLSNTISDTSACKISIKEIKKFNMEIIENRKTLSFLSNKFDETAAKIKNYEELNVLEIDHNDLYHKKKMVLFYVLKKLD